MVITSRFTCPLPNDGDLHKLTTEELMKLLQDAYDIGHVDGKDELYTELSTLRVCSSDKNSAFMNEYCSKCSVKFCDPHKKPCLENCVKYYKYSGKTI